MKLSITKILMALTVLMFVATAASCASNKKCNGKKGVKTPMGLM